MKFYLCVFILSVLANSVRASDFPSITSEPLKLDARVSLEDLRAGKAPVFHQKLSGGFNPTHAVDHSGVVRNVKLQDILKSILDYPNYPCYMANATKGFIVPPGGQSKTDPDLFVSENKAVLTPIVGKTQTVNMESSFMFGAIGIAAIMDATHIKLTEKTYALAWEDNKVLQAEASFLVKHVVGSWYVEEDADNPGSFFVRYRNTFQLKMRVPEGTFVDMLKTNTEKVVANLKNHCQL